MEEQEKIIPLRFVPFDIGCSINSRLEMRIRQYLDDHYSEISVDDPKLRLLSASSTQLIIAFNINKNIDLYIFSYGIGVCAVIGQEFVINQENYSAEYCACRKEKHEAYLKNTDTCAKTIRKIADTLRKLAKRDNNQLRLSANNRWENNGLSYVMTVSHVLKTDLHLSYKDMTKSEKYNLHVLLEPGIIHKEDSLIYTCYQDNNEEPYGIDLAQMDAPKNLLCSKTNAIYISWAAVLVYGRDYNNNLQNIITAFEIGLQAMWMNVYCLYEELVKNDKAKKRTVSQLQKELSTFCRMFHEFKRISDSSLPSYIIRIREELIKTSRLDEYAMSYQSELQYLIAETNSMLVEKQKKYSWLSELLLFLITFIQIAPMLYDVLSDGLPSLNILPSIIMIVIIIVAVIAIIRKD